MTYARTPVTEAVAVVEYHVAEGSGELRVPCGITEDHDSIIDRAKIALRRQHKAAVMPSGFFTVLRRI